MGFLVQEKDVSLFLGQGCKGRLESPPGEAALGFGVRLVADRALTVRIDIGCIRVALIPAIRCVD